MSEYYFDTLKKALATPQVTEEGLNSLISDTQFFFGVLRVKLESLDPKLRDEAALQIKELKELLEEKTVKQAGLFGS